MNISTEAPQNREKVKIRLRKTGSLSMFGYKLRTRSASIRQKALRLAVEHWGSAYVIRKLNVLAIYRKRKEPEHLQRALEDMAYVQRLRDRMSDQNRNANKMKTRKRIEAKLPAELETKKRKKMTDN
jgi:hypothetical protein